VAYESRLSLTVDSRSGEQNLKGFRSQLDSTEKSGTKLVTKTRELTNTFGKMAVGVGLAGAALATYYTKQGLAAVDAQAKLARNVNGTYDALSSLKVAFEDNGIEGFDSSINRMNRRLGAAETGTGAAANAVKILNLDLEALSKMDVDERIASIADSIRDSGASAQQAARHAQDLGFEQQSAGAFFLQGGDAIRSYRKEIDEFGLSISELDTIKIEQANDEFAKTGRLIEGMSMQMGKQLAPVVSALSQLFVNTAKEAGGMDKVVEKAFNKTIDGAALAINAGQGLARVFEVTGKAIAVGMAGAQVTVLSLAKAIIDGPIDAANTLIRGMNNLGASIKEIEKGSLSNALGADIALAKGIVKEGLADIEEALLRPIDAGDTFKRLVSEAQDAADESAKAVLKSQELTVKKFAKNYEKAGEDSGEKSGDEFSKAFESHTKNIANSLQDAITQGNWAGVGATVGGALAGGIAGAVTNKMAGTLGESIAASIAAPMIGALAGGLAGLAFSKLGGLFSSSYVDPTAERQATQGTGTVLGSINEKSRSIEKSMKLSTGSLGDLVGINRSMLNALRGLQAGITGASTRVARASSGVDMVLPSAYANGFDANFVTKMGGEYLNAVGSFMTLGLFNGLGNEIGKLLGGKSRQTDEGIEVIGGTISDLIDETMVQAYGEFRVKKHAASRTKTKVQVQKLGKEVSNQFSLVFESVLDTVTAGADILGISSDAASGFKIKDFKLSTEGLDANEQRAELEAYFGTVFDDLAKHTIPWLDEFQRAGEGLGETLSRVVAQTQAVDYAIESFGLTFTKTDTSQIAQSVAKSNEEALKKLASTEEEIRAHAAKYSGTILGRVVALQAEALITEERAALELKDVRSEAARLDAQAREYMIEAADGLDTFLSSMSNFVNNFATEQQKFDIAHKSLESEFSKMAGISLPATREGFYELMQAQDGATKTGADNIATLLRIQGVADSYYSSLEEQARKATDLQIEQAKKAADAQISLIREQADAQSKIMRESMAMTRSALSVAQAAASAVDNALLGLQGTAASGSKLRRDSALTMLQQMANSGKVSDNLGGALAAATNINMREFSSFDDYIREVARTGAVLTDLKQVTDKQVSREEALLEAIEKRLEAMQRDSNDRQAAIAKNTASTVTLLTRQEVGANA